VVQVSHKEPHEFAALGLDSRLLVAEVLGKDVADAFHTVLCVPNVRSNRREAIYEILVSAVDTVDVTEC